MHIIIWKYIVKNGCQSNFEEKYGLKGIWDMFFKKQTGYITTELLKGLMKKNEYFTLDKWISKEHYEECLSKNIEEYKKIDYSCESMTESEEKVGEYTSMQEK